jgi:hypothetical protein
MPQHGFQNGVNLDPQVVDYVLKKKDPSYQAQPRTGRAQQLLEELEAIRGRQASPEYQARMAASQQGGIDPGMVSAFAKLSAQAGTIGGKAADTGAVDDMANAVERQRQQRNALGQESQRASDRYQDTRLKNALAYDEAESDQAKMLADREYKDRDYKLKQDQLAHQKASSWRSNSMKEKELALREKEMGKSVYAEKVEGVDENGKPIVNLIDKHGKVINTLAGKTPPPSPTQKTDAEANYRFVALKNNAQKLKDLIQEHGTFELTGDAGAKMDSVIYQMAVDYAKLVDPDSVAREGEVAAAQKYMLPVRETTMGIPMYKNSTAVSLVDNYMSDLDQRIAARKAGQAGDTGAQVYEKPQGGESGTAYATGTKQYKKGDSFIHPDGTKYIFNGSEFEEE